jgi:hypothetical protein
MATNPYAPPAQILRFSRQYLQLEPSPQFPDGEILREEEAQDFLYSRLFAPDAASHPPPPRYQLRILKELVSRIENSIDDWEEYVSNSPGPLHPESCWGLVNAFPPSSPLLLIETIGHFRQSRDISV